MGSFCIFLLAIKRFFATENSEDTESSVSLVFLARAVLKACFCDGRLPSSTRPAMALSFKLTKIEI